MHNVAATSRKRAFGRLQRFLALSLRLPWLRTRLRQAVQRLGAPRAIAQRLPVEATFEVELYDRSFTYVSSLNDGVGRVLYWCGVSEYEPETLSEFIRRARESRVILDVGANTGLFSLSAATLQTDVEIHAFEPSPAVFSALERNVRANGLSDQILCHRVAVADWSGTTELHVPLRTWASATLGKQGFRGNDGHIMPARTVTLDEYVARVRLSHVDLIKIDVEGAEHRVLAGARGVLGTHRPAVFCECLRDASVAAINALLGEVDYTPFSLSGAGAAGLVRIQPDPHERVINFLLLPRESLGP
jgi:FkbM family methyltransferase